MTAKKELNKSKIVTIYLAPTESDGTIQYEATVKTIKLDPTEDDPEQDCSSVTCCQRRKTRNSGGRRSAVSRTCRKVATRPLSSLSKASDELPVNDSYGCSYALALEDESSVESQPEELPGPNGYFEGALHQVTVNAYERNRAARKACIKKHGSDCSVCGFSFGTVFGHIGLDYIHIHHLRPLATIKAGYVVDPIEDLRPVCANCHSMLHRRTPPYSINELRSVIALKAASH